MSDSDASRPCPSPPSHQSNVVNLVCGPTEFRWNSVVARVENVIQYIDRTCVIVLAAGDDPHFPSEYDIGNARLTTVVVSHQPQFRDSSKSVSTYLKYAGRAQCEVRVDLEETTRMIKEQFAHARWRGDESVVPTPVLCYLLNMGR